MQDYNLNDWQAAKGTHTIKTSKKDRITIRVSCTQDVQVFGLRSETRIPLKIGREFTFKAKLHGFTSIELKGKPNCLYGFAAQLYEAQQGEPLNNDNPPAPPMPPAGNLLLEMRNQMNEVNRQSRYPVLEPETLFGDHQPYAIDDNDFRFEEELYASQQSPDEDNPPSSDTDTPTPPAAEEPPTGEQPPTETAHAAE